MTTAWQPLAGADGGPRRATLAEVAAHVGGTVSDPVRSDLEVVGVRSLGEAGAEHLSFVYAAPYLSEAAASEAAAFLVPTKLADAASKKVGGRPLILVDAPKKAAGDAHDLFHELRRPAPGIHPTAVVGDGCELADDVSIGPYAVLGDGCRIGPRGVVEAHAVLGHGCHLGSDTWLHAHAVLYDGCRLGDRVRVHSGAVLGAHGFGYATEGGIHHKVPQVGTTVLGDDVEVGALSAVDRAMADATVIGDGSKIDNLVQVGHNVRTGKGCIFCGGVGIGGSTVFGDYVVLGGHAGVVDHAKVATGVQASAGTILLRDHEEPGEIVAGKLPATEIKTFRRQSAAFAKLPELLRRVRRLEKLLAEHGEHDGETEAERP